MITAVVIGDAGAVTTATGQPDRSHSLDFVASDQATAKRGGPADMAITAIGMTTCAMVAIGCHKSGVGEIAATVGHYRLIAGLHAVDVVLCSCGIAFVAATAGFAWIGADFVDYAFMCFMFIIGVRRAAVTFDTTDFGMYIFFQVLFTVDKHPFPYLQRR